MCQCTNLETWDCQSPHDTPTAFPLFLPNGDRAFIADSVPGPPQGQSHGVSVYSNGNDICDIHALMHPLDVQKRESEPE